MNTLYIVILFFLGIVFFIWGIKLIKLGKVKIKEIFFWEFPLFLKYIITEPFIELLYFLKLSFRKMQKLEKPNVWLYINLFLIIVFIAKGDKKLAITFSVLYVLIFLRWVWEQKEYIRKWRKSKGEYIRRDFVEKVLEEKRK